MELKLVNRGLKSKVPYSLILNFYYTIKLIFLHEKLTYMIFFKRGFLQDLK